MRLGELIEALEKADRNLVVREGFSTPHSDRGDYSNLAFTPVEGVTVGSMLDYAKSALGKTFTGYKGGDFVMNEYTEVFIGEWGDCGEGISSLLIRYMLRDAVAMRQGHNP